MYKYLIIFLLLKNVYLDSFFLPFSRKFNQVTAGLVVPLSWLVPACLQLAILSPPASWMLSHTARLFWHPDIRLLSVNHAPYWQPGPAEDSHCLETLVPLSFPWPWALRGAYHLEGLLVTPGIRSSMPTFPSFLISFSTIYHRDSVFRALAIAFSMPLRAKLVLS